MLLWGSQRPISWSRSQPFSQEDAFLKPKRDDRCATGVYWSRKSTSMCGFIRTPWCPSWKFLVLVQDFIITKLSYSGHAAEVLVSLLKTWGVSRNGVPTRWSPWWVYKDRAPFLHLNLSLYAIYTTEILNDTYEIGCMMWWKGWVFWWFPWASKVTVIFYYRNGCWSSGLPQGN